MTSSSVVNQNIKAILLTAAFGIALAAALGTNVAFAAPSFAGQLYYNGEIVRTVAPPAGTPHQGVDPFYEITNGVSGQLSVTAVAPGSTNYHGGHWEVFKVTFNEGVTPYLLTSQAAVLAAQSAGQVTIVRDPSADILCPVQP